MVDSIVAIDARNADGTVKSDIKDEISQILQEKCKDKDVIPILHWVVGSKTGIIDDITQENIKEVQDMNGILVLDEC
jgi:hypothetical protein